MDFYFDSKDHIHLLPFYSPRNFIKSVQAHPNQPGNDLQNAEAIQQHRVLHATAESKLLKMESATSKKRKQDFVSR